MAAERGPPAGRLALLAALAYCALQVALYLTHEPFRDEAQAWLVARSLAGLPEFVVIPGEGHPPLWFWLLRGLSHIADFDTARIFSVGVAMVNAALLLRLLRDDLPTLCLMLASHLVLQYWGYYFRPYGLILTCVLVTLLLDRSGRHALAHWLMAATCGLQFMAGALFAFWLLVALRRGRPWPELVGPCLLAVAFGVSAVLSASGNAQAGLDARDHLLAVAEVLAWPFALEGWAAYPGAAVALLLVAVGLRRSSVVLAAALAAALAFAVFSALVYSAADWHLGFLLCLLLMAFVVAGPGADRRVLVPLLAFQAASGLWLAGQQVIAPQVAEATMFARIVADAEPDFVPESQLVGWPDFVLSATAARHDLTYVSGTTGAVLGPVDYTAFVADRLAVNPALAALPAPFWLVCLNCDAILAVVTEGGRPAVLLDTRRNAVGELLSTYRIDPTE